ncbi:MAG TPA: hypothetical protein VF456_07730 [Vicinamibacterales bacterium]
MTPLRPSGAYAQWLLSRLASLRDLHQYGRSEDIRSLASDLAQSAHGMGHREVEAAAQAIRRWADNPPALEAAIEILRRIAKRAAERTVRNAA